MKELVKNLIAALLTGIVVSLITLQVPAVVVTLLTFIPLKFVTDKALHHIHNKLMPTACEWVTYSGVFVGCVLMVVGFYYHSIGCLIACIVAYVVAAITRFIQYYEVKKLEKKGNK